MKRLTDIRVILHNNFITLSWSQVLGYPQALIASIRLARKKNREKQSSLFRCGSERVDDGERKDSDLVGFQLFLHVLDGGDPKSTESKKIKYLAHEVKARPNPDASLCVEDAL